MLSHVLSFPAYLPSAHEVRANLLLYDRMSTIVPRVDQKDVLDRDAISSISGFIPPDAFAFFDPTYAYVDWFGNEKTKSLVKKKVDPSLEGMDIKRLVSCLPLMDRVISSLPEITVLHTTRLLIRDGGPLRFKSFPQIFSRC